MTDQSMQVYIHDLVAPEGKKIFVSKYGCVIMNMETFSELVEHLGGDGWQELRKSWEKAVERFNDWRYELDERD